MATQAAVGIQLNEANLIRAGQRGDQQAVEALFRRYQRPLFQTALSPVWRTAFVLGEVQGCSPGEAAKKLGVTENTLKARLWRARHQMAERLGRRLRRMKDGIAGGMGEAECSYC